MRNQKGNASISKPFWVTPLSNRFRTPREPTLTSVHIEIEDLGDSDIVRFSSDALRDELAMRMEDEGMEATVCGVDHSFDAALKASGYPHAVVNVVNWVLARCASQSGMKEIEIATAMPSYRVPFAELS